MINGELIVDNFAGGGGASTGIELATGYSVDIAINHDPEAIRMHRANHPSTRHYCESVWDVDPVEVCKGHPVALAWFSPDCKHFSKAKGGKPKDKSIRGLAWVALRWAALVRPRVIMLENVEEFKTWGPLNRRHHPIKSQQGVTFRKFTDQLKGLGYRVEYRELVAADYGTPTMRKRFFLIARCDGRPIAWPEPTHAPAQSPEVAAGIKQPYVGAYTQIDFSLPCPSIFETAEEIREKYGIKAVRPLAPKTMERIYRGLVKFILQNPEPYIVQTGFSTDRNYEVSSKSEHCLIAPTLIQYHSETAAGEVRGQNLQSPVMTVDGSNRYGLVASFLSKFYKTGDGQDIREPLGTVTATAGGGHFAEVRTFLERFDVYESNRSNKRTGGARNHSCEKGWKVLEDIEQAMQSERADSDRTEKNGSAFEIGVPGNSCKEGRKTISDACTQGNVGVVCGRDTARDGYQSQERKEARQQSGQPRGCDPERESYPCSENRVEDLQQLSRAVFKESEGITRQGNVVFTDSEGVENITNDCIQGGQFQAHTLIKYYGQGTGQDIKEPLDTIPTHDRFGLVTIRGVDYRIVDIGLRMLEPRELYGCQGFPEDYIIDRDYTGKTYSRSEQVKRCGNAVCPPIPAALVRVNLPELCVAKRTGNMRIAQERSGQLSFM